MSRPLRYIRVDYCRFESRFLLAKGRLKDFYNGFVQQRGEGRLNLTSEVCALIQSSIKPCLPTELNLSYCFVLFFIPTERRPQRQREESCPYEIPSLGYPRVLLCLLPLHLLHRLQLYWINARTHKPFLADVCYESAEQIHRQLIYFSQ